MQPNLPQDIGTELEDIRRRLRALETSPSMQYTAQKGGSFQLLSPTTSRAMEVFGQFNSAGSPFYGIAVYDGQGNSVIMTRDDENGLVKPDIPLPFKNPTGASTSSGTFTNMFEVQIRAFYHDTVVVEVAVQTPGGTTAEVRISDGLSANATAVAVIPSGGNGRALFTWLHPFGVGDDGNGVGAYLRVDARVTGGAGAVTVYPPTLAMMTSSTLVPSAAANGNPQFV